MKVETYTEGSVVIEGGTSMGEFLWVVLNGKLNKYDAFDVIGDSEIG